jgi:hypothetical protein
MKKFTLYLVATGIVLLIYGCNDPLGKIELSNSKILTRCFISPQDTLLIAYVGTSKTFTLEMVMEGLYPNLQSEDTVNQIKNAKVTLSDKSHSVQLAYKEFIFDVHAPRFNNLPPDGAYYCIRATEFPIHAGETYTLTVTTPDGKVAQATCTVPLQAPAFDMEYSIQQRIDSGYGVSTFCDFNLTWNDFPGQGDYYLVTDRTCDSIFYSVNSVTRVSAYYYGNIDITLDNTLFNDNLSDGETYIYKHVGGGDWPYNQNGTFLKSKITLYTFVLHIDENYYRYHRSIVDQIKAKGNALLEPILIYTNFKGGIGVFAAYNRAQKVVPLNY